MFREAGPDAKLRLVNRSRGFQQRQVYRDYLARLGDGQQWELEPEEGETLRWLKVNTRRAANELGLNIRYGETNEGTLLVWQEAPREQSGRRGRPRKVAAAE